MQEFFMDYGLWLLIALLVIIGIVFLLSGRNKPAEPPVVVEPKQAAPVAAPVAAPPVPELSVTEPPVAKPVEPVAPPPAPEPVAAGGFTAWPTALQWPSRPRPHRSSRRASG